MSTLAAMPSMGETNAEAVARRLRGRLAEEKISGAALGRMIGEPRSTMSRLLNGVYPLNVEQLYKIEAETGITVLSLMGIKTGEGPAGGGPEGQSTPGAGAGQKSPSNLYKSAASNVVDFRPGCSSFSAPAEHGERVA